MWLPSISGNLEAIRSRRGVDWTCPSACSRSGDRDWGSYPSKTAVFHPKNDDIAMNQRDFLTTKHEDVLIKNASFIRKHVVA